jgi:hypothetical protein
MVRVSVNVKPHAGCKRLKFDLRLNSLPVRVAFACFANQVARADLCQKLLPNGACRDVARLPPQSAPRVGNASAGRAETIVSGGNPQPAETDSLRRYTVTHPGQ